MRLSLGRLGLPFARGGAWTPAKLASLGAYWWRADRGVTLREAGPDWPSQGSHVRGLSFDGSTNYVDLGDSPLYDDTAVALSITVLAYVDASEQVLNSYLYSEGNSGSSTQHFGIGLKSTAGQMFMVLRDDAGTYTSLGSTKSGVLTDEAWNVITLVLDASGWGVVVNGVEKLTLGGTAYDNSPATTTFNRATIGALGRNSYSTYFEGPVAYGMRHDSALSLAQCRQVQQYIAEQVAGDGITLTIAGSETANANSPLNNWPFSEDAAGAEVADIAGSVTGVRQPGDRVTTWVDRLRSISAAMGTTSAQPRYVLGADGLPYVDSIPGERLEATLAAVIPEPFTVLTVMDVDHDDTALRYMLGSKDGATSEFRVGTINANSFVESSQITGGRALLNASGTQIYRVQSGNDNVYYDGGSDQLGGNASNALGNDFTIFGNAGSGGTSYVKLRELVIVPAALDTATLNQWLAYVERRWGLSYTEIT